MTKRIPKPKKWKRKSRVSKSNYADRPKKVSRRRGDALNQIDFLETKVLIVINRKKKSSEDRALQVFLQSKMKVDTLSGMFEERENDVSKIKLEDPFSWFKGSSSLPYYTIRQKENSDSKEIFCTPPESTSSSSSFVSCNNDTMAVNADVVDSRRAVDLGKDTGVEADSWAYETDLRGVEEKSLSKRVLPSWTYERVGDDEGDDEEVEVNEWESSSSADGRVEGDERDDGQHPDPVNGKEKVNSGKKITLLDVLQKLKKQCEDDRSWRVEGLSLWEVIERKWAAFSAVECECDS